MRKVAILFAVISFLLLSLWFFQNQNNLDTQNNKVTDTNKKIITLKFGHNSHLDSALHQAALRFSNDVKKKTDGKINIEIFPAQKLGNDHKMLEMARNGELDILLTPTAKMSLLIPSMQYADLPFFFPSREDLYEMLDGEPGKILLKKLNNINLIGVTFWENGFKHFTSNFEITSPDDFNGKKIRVMKSRMIMEQFKSLGAEPIAIDFHSTKQALADKVVDGQENPLIAIESMGFYKEQTHMTLSEHAYLGYVFSISKKILEKISQDKLSMLMKSAQEVTSWERIETQKKEAALIKTIEDYGVTVTTLSDENRLKFAEKTSNIVKKFEASIGSDLISKTQELLYEKYSKDSNEEIVIGIDASLTLGGQGIALAIKQGAEVAIDEINEQGGLLGKKLRLIVKDNKLSSSIGAKNIMSYIDNKNVVAILGGKYSSVVAEEIPLVQTNKIPFIIPWAAAAENTENGYDDNYVFRVSANDRYASRFLVDAALKKYKHPIVLVENSIWGRNNLAKMKDYLVKKGISKPTTHIFNRGKIDYTQELTSIMKNNDSIILVANAKESSVIIQNLVNQNKVLPIVSHWGILGGTFFEDNKEVLKNLEFQFLQTFSFDDKNLKANELFKNYMKIYGVDSRNEIKVAVGIAQAYDSVHLLALAIKEANSTSREKIKASLENLPSHLGAIKYYQKAFNGKSHDALDKSDYCISIFTGAGNIVPVK